jgi:chromosome segregation ATPase
MPAPPDPRPEMRVGSENLEKEMERKQEWKTEAEKAAAKMGAELQSAKIEKTELLKDTQEVVGDITREFKVQQNEYRKKIESLQAYVAELEKKLSETHMKIRKTRDKFERQRHQKDEIIQKNIIKSEQMAQEFRDMLKGTLVKMSDRIEMSRESEENQPMAEVPAQEG